MSDRPLPLLVACAPNGAYKTKRDHPAVPISAGELADTAVNVMDSGASMLHLHVRDDTSRHTLDANRYRQAVAAVRARVGNNLFIQLTSESGGIYSAEQQRMAIRSITADGVSIALRELIPSDEDVTPTGDLLHELNRQGVLIQYILFSMEDIDRYESLLARNVIPPTGQSVLLVLGRYGRQPSTPAILQQMLDALRTPVNWMVCAFGEREFDCLVQAVKLGGHVRIGFENHLYLKTGELAEDNAQLIDQLVESGELGDRPLADIRQARRILSGDPPFAVPRE